MRLPCLVLVATLALCGCNCGGVRTQPSLGALTIEPAELDFGELEEGRSVALPLTLINDGRAPLGIEQAVLEDDDRFSVSLPTPTSLSGGQSVDARVEFSAVGAALGEHRATLGLSLSGADEPRATVVLRARVRPRLASDGGTDGGTDGGVDAGHQYWIAFDSNRAGGTRDLYAVRPDGTDLRQLTSEAWTEMEPAFSPDGTRLAFASDRNDFTLQLYVMDLRTRAVTQVTDAGLGSSQPAWSPDGTRLAFFRDIGVYTIRVDGTDERHIADGLNALNAYQHPAYLPGGNWLIMSRTNEIDLIRTDGTGLRQVIENTTTQINAPSPSPSGASVAFAAYCGGSFSVRSAPTSALTSACSGASEVHFPGRRPAWGPAGIAYETDDANAEIELVDPTGGAAVNLSRHAADDRNPAWSPAGAFIP